MSVQRAFTPRAALLIALLVLLVGAAVALVGIFRHDAAVAPTGTELAGVVLGLAGLLAALVALRAVIRDAREHARVAHVLQASERRFSGILDIAADAIISIGEDQKIVHFNQGAEEIFGWTAAEMLGQPLSVLLPERFRTAHARHVGDFGESPVASRRMGDRSEIFGLRRDGVEFPAEASISRLHDGDQFLFTVVLRNIEYRKRQEEDERFLARAGVILNASLDYDATLRSVVNLPVPHLADCCVLDIVEADRGVRQLVSVHETAEQTRYLRALEDDRLPVVHWPFPATAAIAQESRIVRNDLPEGWEDDGAPDDDRRSQVAALRVSAFATIPLSARGRTVGALTLISTDRKRQFTADRLVAADRLVQLAALAIDNAGLYQQAQRAREVRDEVLGIVSHDLRNPLSAVSMCARVLLHEPPGDAGDRRELLTAVLESTELMHRLIEDLLDVSVIDSGHLTVECARQDLPEMVSKVVEMLAGAAEQRDIELRTAVPDKFPALWADETRVVQALANLLGNAIKFTPAGGRVVIEAEARDGFAQVAVHDTGVGIPAEHLPHVFNRYWHARRRSQTAGTGLGLAIARGVVEAHGGRIWVLSTVDSGSSFFLTLPLAEQAGVPRLDQSVAPGSTMPA